MDSNFTHVIPIGAATTETAMDVAADKRSVR